MDTSNKIHLERAVDLVGGQNALAKAIGVKQQHVWNWLNRDKIAPPAEQVIPIEIATGGKVTRHELRPDLYPDGESNASMVLHS